MRLLVIEHLSTQAAGSNVNSLGDEGFAMLRAVCRDLGREEDVEVSAAVHSRLGSGCLDERIVTIVVDDLSRIEITAVAATYDGVLLIAPEIDGIAFDWAKRLEGAGARLLSPSSSFISWASDKRELAYAFPECFPPTIVAGDSVPLKWGNEVVVKPRDGVGGLFSKIASREALDDAIRMIREEGHEAGLIVQPRIQGGAISVSVIARGAKPPAVLPPFEQIIQLKSDSPNGAVRQIVYAGGTGPLEGCEHRIEKLMGSFLNSIHSMRGWFGVDLILADDGRDVIVDVNPRLTTSYVGYSSLFPGITARLLLGRESENDVASVRRKTGRSIRFDPTGYVEAAS